MRSGFRTSGLLLSHGAVALLAALAAVCAPAQAPTSAGATTATDAKPPVYPKKFFRGANGQLYVPAGVPVGLGIMLTGSPDGAQTAAEDSNQSSVVLKEGPTSLQFGDTKVPVIADGTPPKTTLTIDESTSIVQNGLRILPLRAKLHLSAVDALSGVARIMISVDGAPFAVQPAGGPGVTQEGKHRLRYFSVDQVGNVEKVQEYAFRPRLHAASYTARDLQVHIPVRYLALAQPLLVGRTRMRACRRILLSSRRRRGTDLSEAPGPRCIGRRLSPYSVLCRGSGRQRGSAAELPFCGGPRSRRISRLSIHGPQFTDKGVRYVTPDAEIELAAAMRLRGQRRCGTGSTVRRQTTVYTAPFHLPQCRGFIICASKPTTR